MSIGSLDRITTDFFWHCSTRRLVAAAGRHTRAYRYYFDYPLGGKQTRTQHRTEG